MTQYLSQEKFEELTAELEEIKKTKMPETAVRIDEARQMGDLSENAEYHAAREQMGWLNGRVLQIQAILDNAEIVAQSSSADGTVGLGTTIDVEVNGNDRTYTIVGAQEADPLNGKISNESPLGEAFLGKKAGDSVDVEVPAGVQTYTIKKVA